MMPAAHARRFNDPLPELADSNDDNDLLHATAADAPATSSTSDESKRRIHTVKRGDSLWQIARTYAVSVDQLKRWNHLGKHSLKPGQTLQISAPN
jgi:membrane-bound lytic murein transglycosylase D